jgi:hypothetical protein
VLPYRGGVTALVLLPGFWTYFGSTSLSTARLRLISPMSSFLLLIASLEAVMNSIRNSLGMRESEIAREPSRLWNPHFYAIFAQVHNTL